MALSIRKKRPIGLGFVFGESLHRNLSRENGRANNQIPHRSIVGRILLLLLFFGGFVIISGRLFYLTYIKGEYYQNLSTNNRVREEQLPAQRGIVLARDGTILAANRPIYKLCDEIGRNCKYLDRDEALAFEAEGKKVIVELGREYPENAVTAHIIGYMSEITAEQLDRINSDIFETVGHTEKDFCQQCYILGDYLGAYGVEEVFEKELRGIPGKRLVEVDSSSRESKELARIEPKSGNNITLAVDLGLQKAGIVALEKALLKSKEGGAFVALDPKTGEILALYSAPTFNPNLFVFSDPAEIEDFKRSNPTQKSEFSNKDVVSLISKSTEFLDELSYTNTSLSNVLKDIRQPLFNRVVSGLYPPASTFKIIMSAAGLEEGVFDEDTLIEDSGVISVGKFSFANWYFTQYGRTEGEITIEQALARSNDIFFYKVGEWLGIEKIESWARLLGVQSLTGIELAGEQEGIFRRNRDWYLGDTYHISIGQGDLSTTPLQVIQWTQIFANDGVKCRPTILRLFEGHAAVCEKMPLSDKTISLIQSGLTKACSPGGTAYPLFDFTVSDASSSASIRDFSYDNTNFTKRDSGGTNISVSCKTGTAEFGDPLDRTHAWLTAYAPAENPEIVITVLVEAGGEGSTDAAPIVKEMLQEWFSSEKK